MDSTGIYFTPMLRHLDRGSQEVDNGHYLNFEYVFGATAAAALYRREMIDDISIHGEFFDSDFFVYREDADVAWRAQLLGWSCLYTPHARGYHVRNVLPGNRRALPAAINMHSVKNRFLMRIKNMTGDLYRRNWFSITVARSGGARVLRDARAVFAQGVCLRRAELAPRVGQAPRNHAPPVRQRRVHGAVVLVQAGQPARAEASGSPTKAAQARVPRAVP